MLPTLFTLVMSAATKFIFVEFDATELTFAILVPTEFTFAIFVATVLISDCSDADGAVNFQDVFPAS